MPRKIWTTEMELKLIEMINGGVTCDKIAAHFGVGKDSITGKARSLRRTRPELNISHIAREGTTRPREQVIHQGQKDKEVLEKYERWKKQDWYDFEAADSGFF